MPIREVIREKETAKVLRFFGLTKTGYYGIIRKTTYVSLFGREVWMGSKGEKTKEAIRDVSIALFSQNGFRAVTMKDICEACKMSRGGLYRHYGSTQEIFEEILAGMVKRETVFFKDNMDKNISAKVILSEELRLIQAEMLDPKTSLSYAIYEYSIVCSDRYMIDLNIKAKKRWHDFIKYGIVRGEFQKVDIEVMTDHILYIYQGIRMWCRVIPIEEKTVTGIIGKIRKDLEREED